MKSDTQYKQTEIGVIPEDWKVGTLGEYCDVKGGKRLPKGDRLVAYKTNHPYIRITDLDLNGINKSGLQYLTEEVQDKIKRYTINKDNIYLSIVGTIGLTGVLDEELDGANLTENAAKLYNFKGIDPWYLSYYLKSQTGQSEIRSKTVGSTQPKLALFRIKEIKVPITDFTEQQKISSILFSLDEKIELNRRMNKTLEEIGKALFRRWFVDFEFPYDFAQGRPDENGAPYKSSGGEMIESDLGEIPKGWSVALVGDYLEILDSKRIPLSNRERAKRQGKYRYFGATGVLDYVDDYLFDGIFLLLGEDGTVTIDGGYPYAQYVWGKFWVNNHAHVLRGKQQFSTEFMKLFFDSTVISSYVTGAVQPKLNQSNLRSIPLLVPSIETSKMFDNIILQLFDQVRKNEDELRLLTNIRDSLLPRLMSGKIRV